MNTKWWFSFCFSCHFPNAHDKRYIDKLRINQKFIEKWDSVSASCYCNCLFIVEYGIGYPNLNWKTLSSVCSRHPSHHYLHRKIHDGWCYQYCRDLRAHDGSKWITSLIEHHAKAIQWKSNKMSAQLWCAHFQHCHSLSFSRLCTSFTFCLKFFERTVSFVSRIVEEDPANVYAPRCHHTIAHILPSNECQIICTNRFSKIRARITPHIQHF